MFKKMDEINNVKTSESGLFIHNKLNLIKRKEKENVFSQRLNKNLTKYIFDFFYMRELSNMCSSNLFFYKCFRDYKLPNWKSEMLNLIDIFNLDIKNKKEEISESILDCIEKHFLFPIKDRRGNFLKIDKEGINLISLLYYDPDMQFQLEKLNSKNNQNINTFNFDLNQSIDLENDFEEINHLTLKTPWKVIYCNNSYNPGNIIFLEEKSTLDFGFSFNHVIKGNYKFYLHQFIINMKNANLLLQIIINDKVVYEMDNFPSKKILEEFKNGDDDENTNNNDIKLKDTYICDINKQMFDSAKNNLEKSLDIEIDTKNSFNSVGSTESNSSSHNLNNKSKYFISNKKEYTIRVRFRNKHLFWKAGWYLDGGRLVRSFHEEEK